MYEVKVNGMTCSGCVNSVSRAVKSTDPNAEVSVDLKTQMVRVRSEKPQSDITASIEDAGYDVVEAKTIG